MPLFVAISGPSGSGKSFLSQQIVKELERQLGQGAVTLVEQDAYYKCQDHLALASRTQTNYDHPSAFDDELLLEHLTQLADQQCIESPIYSYQHHTRTDRTQTIHPAPIILVEGILLLANEQLRSKFDLSLFVDTDIELCLARRVARDSQQRGRTESSIVAQFEATVRPMYQRFIVPSKQHADILLSGLQQDTHGQLQAVIQQIFSRLGDEPSRPLSD
ncbi:uridine kinase [Neiella marina]|uniref:uridine/cytidine kinase n=1 Tax=Neiella holothuriorum TaxID=2870530 RepID=A0ABS7EKT8_9GAMM|nr:uridine kinase [Neiella holothuriorum]MBW8192386.1 uridine kinase [Neiella holothuriorum]